MFRTKKDVDKHVQVSFDTACLLSYGYINFLQDINSKIKNSSERALKGYAIAKLYHTVGTMSQQGATWPRTSWRRTPAL